VGCDFSSAFELKGKKDVHSLRSKPIHSRFLVRLLGNGVIYFNALIDVSRFVIFDLELFYSLVAERPYIISTEKQSLTRL
jgi:hypothetical protein